MVEIKNVISFDEFNAIVNKVVDDCFVEGKYSPAYYEISLRTALLCAFAPDFSLGNFDDNNTLFETVMSDKADIIIDTIKENRVYLCIEEAINKTIDYRIKKSNSLETALTNLVTTFIKQMNNIPEIPAETLEQFTDVIANSNNQNLAQDMVNVMVDEGMLSKPNRETRRKNGQRSTKAKTKIVKEDE